MCYHARKKSSDPSAQPAFLFQQRTDTDSEDGSPRKRRLSRVKTVSFSTGPQTESERSVRSEDKENQPEELDLTDSMEVVSTLAKGLPTGKGSVSSSYVVWRRAGDAPLADKPTNELNLPTADPRPSPRRAHPPSPHSYSARTSPVRLSTATPLVYCPACDRDSRTLIVFETVPVRGLQSLLCCWNGTQKNQVMTVHKCVTCKRVIARLVQ